jgi:hypothetical protein
MSMCYHETADEYSACPECNPMPIIPCVKCGKDAGGPRPYCDDCKEESYGSPTQLAIKFAKKYKDRNKEEVVRELRQPGKLNVAIEELTGHPLSYFGGNLFFLPFIERFKSQLGITDADFD